MANNELNTEGKILQASCDTFLLFGFHGTKLRRIAEQAGVNISVIHYYFRSKEKLYEAVVKVFLEKVLNPESNTSISKAALDYSTRFFCI